MSAAEAQAQRAAPGLFVDVAAPQEARASLVELDYRDLADWQDGSVVTPEGAAGFALEIVNLLADTAGEILLVVNCNAGLDRSGTINALVQSLHEARVQGRADFVARPNRCRRRGARAGRGRGAQVRAAELDLILWWLRFSTPCAGCCFAWKNTRLNEVRPQKRARRQAPSYIARGNCTGSRSDRPEAVCVCKACVEQNLPEHKLALNNALRNKLTVAIIVYRHRHRIACVPRAICCAKPRAWPPRCTAMSPKST